MYSTPALFTSEMWAMLRNRPKTKANIANFEKGDRNVQVSIEFDSPVKTERPSWYQLAIGLIKSYFYHSYCRSKSSGTSQKTSSANDLA